MNSFPRTALQDRLSKACLVAMLCLMAAMGWSVLLRVPLIVNASAHLDSDLAVDGLTLMEALNGHWRWHYPGTPYMGTGAILLSWPQAMVFGAGPETLVSGGTVAQVLIMLGVFTMAWCGFGRRVALWALVPLTFASTGALWLSSRITGGHLLVVAWSAWAWVLWLGFVRRVGRGPAAALGVWCGLGLYLDSMYVMTLAGLGVAACVAWLARSRGTDSPRSRVAAAGILVALVLGFLLGVSPRWIGNRVEPHDAYSEQFAWSLDPQLLGEHSRILFLECLPRFIAGHRLPGLEADPDPLLLGRDAPIKNKGPSSVASRGQALLLTLVAVGLFIGAIGALAAAAMRHPDAAARSLAAGLTATSLLLAATFAANRNIFNAENQRYLVLLLISWPLGFGLEMDRWSRRKGTAGAWLAGCCAAVLAVLFTWDAAAWYRQLAFVDSRMRPVGRTTDDPALRWIMDHPEVTSIYGGYWDVYRLSFLTAGKVKGIPFPMYPDRYPEWSAGMPERRPETLLTRRTPDGQLFLGKASRDGAKVLHREGGLTVMNWPWTPAPPR